MNATYIFMLSLSKIPQRHPTCFLPHWWQPSWQKLPALPSVMDIPVRFYSRIFLFLHFSHPNTTAEQARVGHCLPTPGVTPLPTLTTATQWFPSPHRQIASTCRISRGSPTTSTQDADRLHRWTPASRSPPPASRSPPPVVRTSPHRMSVLLPMLSMHPLHSCLLMSTIHCYVCMQLDWYVFAI
jgi:hypothetical protein